MACEGVYCLGVNYELRREGGKQTAKEYRREPTSRGRYEGRAACSIRCRKNTGGTPGPLLARGGASNMPFHETNPFCFRLIVYAQQFMKFAARFANGFVLEKRTHFRGVKRGSGSELGGRLPLRLPFGRGFGTTLRS